MTAAITLGQDTMGYIHIGALGSSVKNMGKDPSNTYFTLCSVYTYSSVHVLYE